MRTAPQVSVADDSEDSALSVNAQREHKQMKEIREGGDQMKLGFAAIIANTFHELRSPLHSMRGFIKLMLDSKTPDPETQREFLAIVDEQSQHLTNLVNDILDLADIESGQMIFERQLVSMNEVIDKVVAKMQKPAQEKRIDIETNLPRTLRNIEGDFRKLEQVVTNLLDNAIKFSKGEGKIFVVANAENNEVLVQITAQSIDISADAILQPFQKFSVVDNSMTPLDGGAWLGFHLAKRVVEAHGGQIWVESEPDNGSTFCFAIPECPNCVGPTEHREDVMTNDALGCGLAVEEIEQAVPVPEHNVKKQQETKSKRRPMDLKDKSLLLRLDESELGSIMSVSRHLGVAPSLLARILLKQAMSRYSREERLDDLFLLSTSPVPATTSLSRREMEILDLMAQGASNNDIADVSKVSEKTVKNHITSILRKLEANNRTHAVVLALRHNLIEPRVLGTQEMSAASSLAGRKAKSRIRMHNHTKCAGVRSL